MYQVVVKKLSHRDVAKEHGITGSYVSYLVRKAAKNKEYLTEVLS